MRPSYPVAYQDFQADLARRFTEYGHSIGLKMLPTFTASLDRSRGSSPKPIAAKHDSCRSGGSDSIHPAYFSTPIPLYLSGGRSPRSICSVLAPIICGRRKATARCAQRRTARNPGDRDRHREKEPKAIRAVDPQAVLFTNSWTFLDRRQEDTKAFPRPCRPRPFKCGRCPAI